jgi:GTPase SAR1 family protein
MGLCTEETIEDRICRMRSQELERQLLEYHKYEKQVHKLLLLGAGGCGKSTIFKQMSIIQNEGKGQDSFTKTEREAYRLIAYANIYHIFDSLLSYAEAKNINLIQQVYKMSMGGYGPVEIDGFVAFLKDIQASTSADFVVKQNDVQCIQRLYNSTPIQELLKHRNEFDISDHSDFFIEKLPRISLPNYLPTDEEILKMRVKTTGIVEKEFEITKFKFRMVDVGGQRNERRKWIHAFDNVTSVIFVMALSEYDQQLAEVENVNRMAESIALFKEICNNRYFRNKSIILFMNKKDVFQEKLKNVRLNVFFKDYQGDNSYESAVKYIEKHFLKQNINPKRIIYPHVTCATDTKIMKSIFDSVKDTILKELLLSSGQI